MPKRRPAIAQLRAASRLGAMLGGPFDLGRQGPGGWVILHEPRIHLAEDEVVPGLAGWRRARMPRLPVAESMTLAPDWACEILSSTSANLERLDRLAIYARERVEHVWLVDPLTTTLEILHLEGRGYYHQATAAGDAKLHAEPFALLALDLAALWER